MILESFLKENVKIISLKGEVTFENSKEFGDSLLSLVDCPQHIILDLKDLRYLNSMGLSMIIKVYTKVSRTKRELRLCSLNDNISKLFSITQLDKVIDIYENQDKALKSVI